MHWLEKKCVSIRRSKLLEPMAWLWGSVRPGYDLFWEIFFKKGLKRVMNGRDMILVTSECRGQQEIYESGVWVPMMQRVKNGYKIADVGANIGIIRDGFGEEGWSRRADLYF